MLEQTISRARNRIVLNRLFSGVCLAAMLFLAGFVLLLLLGTRIFDWWIPVSLGVAALAVALFRTFFRAPAALSVARLLDRNCSLSDALSTALHFRAADQDIALCQRRQADQAAAQIDFRAALPWARPRSLYPAGLLLVFAALLFTFRFGFEQRLSFDRPVSFLNLDPLGVSAQARTSLHKAAPDQRTNPLSPEQLARLGTSTPDNPDAQDITAPRETSLAGGNKDSGDPSKTQPAGGKKGDGEQTPNASSDPGDGSQKAAGEQSPSSQEGDQQGAQQASKAPGNSDSSGLLSKLKDAVSSLMSKMKPQSGQAQPQNGQQQSQQASNKPANGQQNGQNQQGQKGESGQQQDGEESASSEPEQSAPGKGSGKSNDQNASAKPGSGMGHQDGSKELKDAEQLAAMGKLSEIIGKRSATVTGEMTIDQQGPQQLRTRYATSSAKHGEVSGDVSRDEIPVALQSYVEQYFEQVRKQAAVKTARAGKPKPQE